MRYVHLLLTFSLLALVGCSSANGKKSLSAQFAREHVFMVDNQGRFRDPAKEWKWREKGDDFHVGDSLRTIKAGIDAWSTSRPSLALASSNLPQRVVVFVHGGLNPYDTSRDRLVGTNVLYSVNSNGSTVTNHVSSMVSSMLASNCYPIFVVWDSDLWGAYWEHLVSIRQGEKHPTLGKLTCTFVLITDIAKGIARLPTTYFGRIYSDAKTTEGMNSSRVKRWEGFEELIASHQDTYRPPQKEGQDQLHTRGRGERTLRFSEYLITTPAKIVTLPIVDGLGTEAWHIMLRRTRTMFQPPDSYEISEKLKRDEWNTEYPNSRSSMLVSNWLFRVETNDTAAMFYFGKTLEHWSSTSFTNLDFEFYGHSMGAIVLNQLFRNHEEIMAKKIVYLAGACSVQGFQSSLFPYLRANTNTQFYGLSLHRIRERGEYPLYGFIPGIPVLRDITIRGSLLNWIDDIFEKPNTITDRTLGAWENATRALPDIPEDLRERIHFRGCPVESMPVFGRPVRFEPQTHGDFSKAIFWSPNFLWPETGPPERLMMY